MGRRVALACVALFALASTCRADGIDIVHWIVRLPAGSNVLVVLVAIVAMLLLDFAVNYVVVGWPVSRWITIDRRTLIGDVIRLTLLGQVADRAGAVLGLFLGALTDPLYPHHGEGSFVVPLLVANLVCTALFIFALVAWFARGKWRLSWKRTCAVAALAAIFTNPIWVLFLVGSMLSAAGG